MNLFSAIWSRFRNLFSVVGSTHPPATPVVMLTEAVEEHHEELLEEAAEDLEFEFVPTNFDRLTKDYTASDFACADGTPVPGRLHKNLQKLAENIQRLAVALGKPVTIFEGYRTEEYNKHIGGHKNSLHLECLAAGLKVKGLSRERLAAKIKELIREGVLDKGGVAVYPGYVHYDIRGKNVSWTGKANKK